MIIIANEKRFETKIKEFLKENNCWFVKYFANGYTKSGVPDILASVNGFFVGIEVKAQRGKPSPLQIHNAEAIRKTGGFAYVVYPSGFDEFTKIIEDLKKGYYSKETPIELK